MKSIRFSEFLCVLLASTQSYAVEPITVDGIIERPIAVVTVGYNNKKFYEWNLNSIFTQKYSNYRLIYVDDNSRDGTGAFVRRHIHGKKQMRRTQLIINQKRQRAMANLYHAIMSCDDNEIVVIVDADDALAHPRVLARINAEYADPDVWITYGQYRQYPSENSGFCNPMPEEIVKNNAYRQHPHGPSHLRTFYAKLFKKIKIEDLMYEGDFFEMTYDLAMMFPMLEMAGGRFRFIEEILYFYNTLNPISDHRVSKELQRNLDLVVRTRKPYEKIESLF